MKPLTLIATILLLGIGCAPKAKPPTFAPPREAPPTSASPLNVPQAPPSINQPVTPPPPAPKPSPAPAATPAPSPAPEPTPPPAPPPPPPPALKPTVQSVSLEADDQGFYPSPTVRVTKGNSVRLTITTRAATTYQFGLEVRSSVFTTGTIQPGGSKTVEFVADQTFSFTSYWPSTNVRKADGQVVVE